LENAFYKEALQKYDASAFEAAGYKSFVRGRFQQVCPSISLEYAIAYQCLQIADHEETHVKFLATALGDKATQPCTYKFPYSDPKSFAALSMALEGVGVSAYLGAAMFISNSMFVHQNSLL
jgi:hypothetical protein